MFVVQTGGGEKEEEGRDEERWSSSQESLGDDWPTDEMELEHLQALSRCSTDDDKISESTPVILSHV